MNPGRNPAILQDSRGRGGQNQGDKLELIALDGRNAHTDLILCAEQVHLQAISGAANLQKKIGINATSCLAGMSLITGLHKSARPFLR